MTDTEVCPECGSGRWDGEECRECFYGLEYLKCPFCGHLVGTVGIDATCDPCACVAAFGSDELYWNDPILFAEAQRLAGVEGDEGVSAQDLGGFFADNADVSVDYISDAGNSGGTYIWYVFLRQGFQSNQSIISRL